MWCVSARSTGRSCCQKLVRDWSCAGRRARLCGCRTCCPLCGRLEVSAGIASVRVDTSAHCCCSCGSPRTRSRSGREGKPRRCCFARPLLRVGEVRFHCNNGGMEAREVSITPRHGHGHGTLGRSSNSAPTSGERARVERLEKKSRNQQRARMERGPQAAGWCADGGAGWQAGFGGLWACWRCVMRGARVHLCVGQPGWSQSAGALAMRAAGRLCRRARCELGRRRCGMAAVVRGPSVSRRRGAGRAAEAERSGATAWSPGCRWGVAGARWVRRAARGRERGRGPTWKTWASAVLARYM